MVASHIVEEQIGSFHQALLKRSSADDLVWFCERPIMSVRGGAEAPLCAVRLLAESRNPNAPTFSAGVSYGLSAEKQGWRSAQVWTSALPLPRALSDEAERRSHDLSAGFVDQVHGSNPDELARAVAAMLSAALANRARELQTVSVHVVCRRAAGSPTEVITVPVPTTWIALSKGHTEVYGGILLERMGIEVLSTDVSLIRAEMTSAGYNAMLSTAGCSRLKDLLRRRCHITGDADLALAAERLLADLKTLDGHRVQANAEALRRAASELRAYCCAQSLPFGSVSEIVTRPETTVAQSAWVRGHGRRMELLARVNGEAKGASTAACEQLQAA